MSKSVKQLTASWENRARGADGEAPKRDFGSNSALGADLPRAEESDPFAAIEAQAGDPYRAMARPRSPVGYEDQAHLGAIYEGEEQASWWRGPDTRTSRLDDAGRSRLRVRVDDEGRLTQGQQRLDTVGSKGMRTDSAEDRMIFAMSKHGDLLAGDQNDETARLNQGRRRDTEFFHHSSFFGSKEVAGAGEIGAEDGLVKRISPNSGHYRPELAQSYNTVNELALRGADLSSALVEHFRTDDDANIVGKDTFHAGEVLAAEGDEDTLEAKADNLRRMKSIDGWLRERTKREIQAYLEDAIGDDEDDDLNDDYDDEDLLDEADVHDGDYTDDWDDESAAVLEASLRETIEERWPGSEVVIDFDEDLGWSFSVVHAEPSIQARMAAIRGAK